MSALTISKMDLEKYISIYGSFHEDDKQTACELARETVIKVIQTHEISIKSFQDLDEAGSYILSWVSELLEGEEGELITKLNQCVKRIFGDNDSSTFTTAVEWGAIDCLKDLLKNHRI